MAIYANTLPYLVAQNKRVALPRNDISDGNKMGYGNLVFLFTKDTMQSIHMMNNTDNCYHDGKYYYYYYNLLYRGLINGRRYNIKDFNERKLIYDRVAKQTSINPHPPSLLNKAQNRNCYYELSKYYEIFSYMTEKYPPAKKMSLFWSFFKSIWFSGQTATYSSKYILINADDWTKFKGTIKECMHNPLFMLYYTLYKSFDSIKDLNIDFLIYCKHTVLKVNPSKCDEKSYLIFKRELQKVFNKMTELNSLTEKEIDEKDQKETLKAEITSKYNFTGSDDDTSDVTDLKKPDAKPATKVDSKKAEIKKKLEDKVEAKIDTAKKDVEKVVPKEAVASKEVTSFIQTKTEMELDDDKELIEDMYKLMQTEKVPTKPISTARDAELRKRQESLAVGAVTFKDLNDMNAAKRTIPVKDVSSQIHNINPNVKKIKFSNANKDYIENVMPSDIMKMITSLNNKAYKFYVRDIKVTDSSNELNYKDTYTIIVEDENKQRHTITVDIPKFLDNKFMYLGGNKKIIDKQNFLYPVVKTAPDTVQIVTNYNKLFLRRIGEKSISSVERILKLISADDACYKYFTVGNNSATNKSYLTTIEYDEFGKVLTKFQSPNCEIFFNQNEASKYAESHHIQIPSGHIFIGTKDKSNLFLDADTQVTEKGESISELIVSELSPELQTKFSKIRSTKKVMYNTATIMSQTIPLVVLLMYWDGLTSVIKKADLKYYFSSKYPSEVKPNESVIRFKDAYFVYEQNLAQGLLMSGIRVLDTENYSIKDYDTAEPYTVYFKKVYGKISIMNAISNYAEFMVDPITEEILKDTNLPTDLVELCIYGNNLLSDESYTIENSQKLSRVRSSEIIPAILYNNISRSYLEYKNSAGKRKLSIQKDCVIKDLLSLQTVEDYSTLNPVVELEKDRAITSKGFRGINVDRAYTEEKRSYDESMVGIIAMSTSPDGNCGINRFLTLEPNITSARGYVDIKTDKKDELKDVNLFSPAEMLYPLGCTRDDSIRTAMACKQSKHVIPVKNSTPALISNGVDEAIRFDLSSDFVINADEDGSVIDFDPKSKIMIIQYKSGKNRAINLAPETVKNGGGGFFLSNELITKLKVGDKFKKDDALAWHKDFFKDDGLNGVRMNVGVLEKVAIVSSYNSYNDSTVITHKLANDAQADMTFCKSVVVGKNANVYSMKQVGEHVNIGDSLISFDTSFDDSDLNKLLAHLSDENKDLLQEGSTNMVKSKYAGTIIDIKIYCTVDLPELSESLQKIVKSYYSKVNEKKKFVSKYDPDSTSIVKCGLLLKDTTGKVEPNIYGVIKGQKVQDSVLIEFYIEHGDIMGVGDKLAYFTALKSIIGEVIPEGYEPYSEFRPEEEVSSIVGPSAVLKRQVPSILLTVLGNKVIVELKRSLEAIYNS